MYAVIQCDIIPSDSTKPTSRTECMLSASVTVPPHHDQNECMLSASVTPDYDSTQTASVNECMLPAASVTIYPCNDSTETARVT